MTTIYVLYGKRNDMDHVFTENFSSLEKLNTFLTNHPECERRKQDGCFDLDPA